jgi:tRNA A37 N6-isopentenylltransferase MiaA
MLPAVETALGQLAGELPTEEVSEIRARSAEVASALEARDTARLRKSLELLDQSTQNLASRLVERAMGSA